MKIIETYHSDLLNGVGLREVLFFSGCEHKCKGCFNEFTWDPDTEQAHKWCESDYQELYNNLSKSYISGVTLSGGDPLSKWNESDVLDLVKRLRDDFGNSKTIWCYSGYTFEYLNSLPDDSPKKQVLNYIDVLCDGPFVKHLKSPNKPWVGSENQRVINVPESLKEKRIILLTN